MLVGSRSCCRAEAALLLTKGRASVIYTLEVVTARASAAADAAIRSDSAMGGRVRSGNGVDRGSDAGGGASITAADTWPPSHGIDCLACQVPMSSRTALEWRCDMCNETPLLCAPETLISMRCHHCDYDYCCRCYAVAADHVASLVAAD
jgi:hypothetical protein